MNQTVKKVICIMTALLLMMVFSPLHSTVSATSSEDYYFDFKSSKFTAPPESNFINWYNQNMLRRHTPHHNGYDSIFKITDSQYIDGKFQYGDFRKDLEGEWISIYAWSFSDGEPQWKKIGRAKTDSDGRIHYVIPNTERFGTGLHLIKLYVEGDGTEANMYIRVLDGNKKYVVFDIDGTLTIDDCENVIEYTSEFWNVIYNARKYEGAVEATKYYASRGYEILYLTARPYWLAEKTQRWLIRNGFPRGLIHTYEGSGIVSGSKAVSFKRDYLQSVKSRGVNFGYGNATSDIDAYFAVGLPGNRIFIIGEHAGLKGTTPVSSYPEHLSKLPE
ncbi:LNS2 domain-containing protein [Baia soyae]|nr:HAD family acid phosphatase [Baia soyae]